MRRILVSAIALVSLCAPSSAASHPVYRCERSTAAATTFCAPISDEPGCRTCGPRPELRGRPRQDGRRTLAPLRQHRIFNDLGQNLFSENDISQWGWAWGQFLDHDVGLRDERPAESAPMPFDKADRLEQFRNDLGVIDFSRTPAAPGPGSCRRASS
jgi:hypothetical protein